MATLARNGLKVSIGAEDGVRAAGSRTPAEMRVVLDKATSDEQLVLATDLTVGN